MQQTPALSPTMASPTASAAFAVPIPVLVVDDRDDVQHRGTLQLPRRAPASPGRPPSSADLARLRPLMRALGDVLAAQEEGLDPERLSRTYTALMAELQEVAGMGVHAVELTPATLARRESERRPNSWPSGVCSWGDYWSSKSPRSIFCSWPKWRRGVADRGALGVRWAMATTTTVELCARYMCPRAG